MEAAFAETSLRLQRMTTSYRTCPLFFSRLSTRRAGVFLSPPSGPLAGSEAVTALCAIVFAVADPDMAGLDLQDLSGSVRAESNMAHSTILETHGPKAYSFALELPATARRSTRFIPQGMNLSTIACRGRCWTPYCFAARVDSRLSDYIASTKASEGVSAG